jgi:hypothetical protein
MGSSGGAAMLVWLARKDSVVKRGLWAVCVFLHLPTLAPNPAHVGKSCACL